MKNNIFIAEDDPGILDVMKMMLEINGYKVAAAMDGPALRLIENMLPDLLLLDILMPGMDGKTIFKHLKSKEKTRHIPIIMVSAMRDLEKVAIDLGADDFLLKPFEMQDLLIKVEKHLNA